ncbi:MAG: Bor family protein [Bacteroidales bacterium]|jgi:hypothetical protein|nr:Bor family protein [Bacteroidales bacterium]MDY0174892.1 Bor family protein [Bacteroidales bacterium]HHV41164.1 hypothetical protein [Bacteroidales bacterium]
MKKIVLKGALLITVALLMTSCYSLTFTVGQGARTGVEVVERNHYLIGGLAPIKLADPKAMAGGAKDYTVTVEHTILDGLLAALTGGIYTPTTVKVRK